MKESVVKGPREGIRGAARVAYLVLAWLLPLCVAYQVYLAGMAIFADPANWGRHVHFVHFFELIPVLLLILAFAGKMPKGQGLYLWPILLHFLIGLQYAFAGAGSKGVEALHPVNAMLIFSGAVVLAQRALNMHRAGARA